VSVAYIVAYYGMDGLEIADVEAIIGGEGKIQK
jgi:hypothetical protein